MKEIVESQRRFYHTDVTKSIRFRKAMLTRLQTAVLQNETLLYHALKVDLNKSESEAYLTEIQMILSEIQTAIAHLQAWDKPRTVRTPLPLFPASGCVYREPYGNVLILAPWNYPVQLALAPLIGAISGGNCAVIKMSRHSKAVSKVIKKMLDEAFPTKYICCLSEEYSYDTILAEPYELIFFTGSPRVGRLVMEAASKHLTPVVLELGGKSPCIVEKTAHIKLAAKRIAWGKFLNAGQTCVAPDYVLVDETVKEKLIEELKLQITKMYGHALENKDYPRIISRHHYDRLQSY
ncbi:MAG: aldehyde dehydrogenase family protein, partial [Lachnospiraceae bacterium]